MTHACFDIFSSRFQLDMKCHISGSRTHVSGGVRYELQCPMG